jgi:uncharacterized membrane protein YfcA
MSTKKPYHWPIEMSIGLAGYFAGKKVDMSIGTYPVVSVLGMLVGILLGDYVARKIYNEPYIDE